MQYHLPTTNDTLTGPWDPPAYLGMKDSFPEQVFHSKKLGKATWALETEYKHQPCMCGRNSDL